MKIAKNRISYLPLILICLVIGGLSFTGWAASLDSGSEASDVFLLKYADQNEATGWEATHAAQPWLEQISSATQGKVRVDAYYSESLTKGANSWDAARIGITDMAWMFHGYWDGMTPLADVLSLPLIPFKSAEQASGIFWQLYEKYPSIREQFKGNHVLITWASTPYFLATSQKQVRTLEDLKGLRIRVPSGPPVEIMKSLGAFPVPLGMPDTYLYLQKGAIDGTATCWEAMLSFRQYEVVKYFIHIPLFTVYFTQAVNISTWNSLPPEIQEQINSVSGLQGSLFWGRNMFDTAANAGREELKNQKVTVVEYTLPAEELARWNEAARPIWDKWAETMSARGYPEAREILNTTLELVSTYDPATRN